MYFQREWSYLRETGVLSRVEAMEVYEFMHGEKVVRQGDTDGAPRPHGPTGTDERMRGPWWTMEKSWKNG